MLEQSPADQYERASRVLEKAEEFANQAESNEEKQIAAALIEAISTQKDQILEELK